MVDDVERGEEIVLTSGGKPVARLIAVDGVGGERIPGSAKGLFTVPGDFDAPLDDFREYS